MKEIGSGSKTTSSEESFRDSIGNDVTDLRARSGSDLNQFLVETVESQTNGGVLRGQFSRARVEATKIRIDWISKHVKVSSI